MESEICERVSVFEKSLKSIGFLTDNKSLSSVFDGFVKNVEELYVRKKCKFLMELSRELMKKKDGLFEMVQIDEVEFSRKTISQVLSNGEPRGVLCLINELFKIEECNEYVSKIDENLKMPKCCVSQTAKTIMDLVYETLNEALQMFHSSSNVKNVSMLCLIAKNLLDLFASVIPTYHGEAFSEFPRLSAIAYNDFIFLAFNCLTLTHQYKSLFFNIRQKSVESSMKLSHSLDIDEIVHNFSCLDLIPKLCWIGVDIFERQISAQRINLTQFLSEDCNGVKDLAEANNFDLFKKALLKCNLQLKNLASIWHGVLPERIFARRIGSLFDLLCGNLIKQCLVLEDISSDDASYLHSALSMIQQCVYDVFSRLLVRTT